MSDYFGALLRASGLAGRPAAAVPVLREVDVEAPVVGGSAAADATTASRESPPAALAPLPSSTDLRRAPATAAIQGAAEGPDAAGPLAESPRGPAAADDADAPNARPTTVSPPSRASQVTIDLPAPPAVVSHPAVQAALRWVAADPQSPPIDALRGLPAEGTDRPAAPVAPTAATAAITTPPAPGDEGRAAPPVAATVRAMSIEARRPPPMSEDEPAVEVSIGSIHLRVDAPAAPQTTTRAAPAAAPAALPVRARSSLARRALPRI